MPRVGEKTYRERQAELAQEEINAFMEPTAWKRSSKKNLWRAWDGVTVTIFQRKGIYQWCIAGAEEPQYSSEGYEAEDDAMIAAGAWIGVGESGYPPQRRSRHTTYPAR
jgi:hypothetical protein